ncbi:hypothetical protein [Thiothrix nivea]|nr:hypothetical protein [Thiothrix nivea]
MSGKPMILAQRIARHPALQERIEAILNIVESRGDDLKLADEAERQIIETLRQLGHDALSGWAEQRAETAVEQGRQEPGWRPMGQKNSTGKAPTG